MKGTIGLRELQIDCIVGVYPDERDTPRALWVDVEIDSDFTAAADSQKLHDTIDYTELATLLRRIAVEGRFHLLESYAESAAAAILLAYPSVARVHLEIRKPGAVPQCGASFVRLERGRQE